MSGKNKLKFKLPSWKMWLGFITFQFVFIGITSILILFYGPFTNVKKTLVGTAMSTYKHQYIATTFLSKEKIDQILASKTVMPEGNNEEVPIAEAIINNNTNEKEEEIKLPTKHDETIERFEIDGKKSKGYLLVITDPTRVRIGYTSKMGIEGQKTSEIAKANNAVAAINGGAFTDRSSDGKIWCGTGGLPSGILMVDGKVVYTDTTSNDQQLETAAFTYDGELIVGLNSINDLIRKGVKDTITFGPTIILKGKAQNNYIEQGIAPRTAVGQRKDGAILFLVMDGRQANSLGTTLDEMRSILLSQGAINAINLDGGSSTTMYYEGEVINNPSDPYGERTIATAIYVEP